MSDFKPHLQGTTFENMMEALTEGFGPLEASREGRDRPLDWRVSFWGDEKLSLVSNQDNGGWGARIANGNLETLAIVVPRAGALEVLRGRARIEGACGQLLLLNSHEAERVSVRDGYHRSDTLSLNWRTIMQAAAAIMDRPLVDPIELASVVDISSAPGELIGNLVQTIVSGMRDNGPLLSSPIATAHLTEALADLIVRTIPHQHSLLLGKKIHLISPRHVRRATELMHMNMAKPLTMSSLAQDVGVSLRALEVGFKTFKGATPLAYLRAIRLQAVHKDLLDPLNKSSIREVCVKWGLLHPGRFAALYRHVYGESPLETRRRSLD